MRGEVPHSMRPFRGFKGATIQKGKRTIELLGSEFMYLGDLIQQYNGESQGQSTPKGKSSSGPYNYKFITYLWVTAFGGDFQGYANQADARWLEICLFGLFFK